MEDHAWLGPSLERIAGLLAMPDRHNSWGSRKVDPGCAKSVVQRLFAHMSPGTPAPRITPTDAGGLRLEWSEPGAGCEVVFEPGESPVVRMEGVPDTQPTTLGDAEDAVRRAIGRLTETKEGP